MRTLSCFAAVLIFFALFSCRKTFAERQYQFPVIELNHCGDTSIEGQTVQICFDSVYDSRCPANMECVWQGEATVRLSLNTGSAHQSFKLSTLNHPPAFKRDTTLLGYTIKLLSVSPYPGSNPHAPYTVELAVTR